LRNLRMQRHDAPPATPTPGPLPDPAGKTRHATELSKMSKLWDELENAYRTERPVHANSAPTRFFASNLLSNA
ncbi:MAG: hypothetical protein JZU63_00695, partial [Rhodoferax sp.]|nr:hypothetical protein [Rhodoferax sp.]